jgi:hypothetical protein
MQTSVHGTDDPLSIRTIDIEEQPSPAASTASRCPACFATLLKGQPCPCGYDVYAETSRTVLAVGTTLRAMNDSTGHYRIGFVLGTGGFAITYLGWDLARGGRVAIKEYVPLELAYRD